MCYGVVPPAATEWAFELLLNESKGNSWVFKRDPDIRWSLPLTTSRTTSDIPYLNPEIVLLHKAGRNIPKDQSDFEQTVDRLSSTAVKRMVDALEIIHPAHPWLERLAHDPVALYETA